MPPPPPAGARPAPPPPLGSRAGAKPPPPPAAARPAPNAPGLDEDEGDELTVDEDELIDDKLS